jgi:hypothetical protein
MIKYELATGMITDSLWIYATYPQEECKCLAESGHMSLFISQRAQVRENHAVGW